MISKLTISAGYREGRSFLKNCFFTRPFRVANISEDRRDPALFLMIMSSSPGLLDGDRHEIYMEVETGARLVLQTQGYQRLFNMKRGASQDLRIQVRNNGSLHYILHPIVPHTRSKFQSETRIDLEEQSELLFGDILTCGRKHSGEAFQYTGYRNKTEIYYNGKLMYKDNIVLDPLKQDPAAIGQFQGYTHQASFVYAFTGDMDLEELKRRLTEIIDVEVRVTGGITRAGKYLLAARFLGMGGEVLFNLLKSLESCIRDDCQPAYRIWEKTGCS